MTDVSANSPAPAEAEAIVRDLAATNPVAVTRETHWTLRCKLCGITDAHADSCPWLRALLWLRENPQEETE